MHILTTCIAICFCLTINYVAWGATVSGVETDKTLRRIKSHLLQPKPSLTEVLSLLRAQRRLSILMMSPLLVLLVRRPL
ncbi:hypothetical protein HYR99_37050 [Candidatus Poribacteria bacterium]|nr:hypothetical protein [Candidatus Poribacteria bacterium]